MRCWVWAFRCVMGMKEVRIRGFLMGRKVLVWVNFFFGVIWKEDEAFLSLRCMIEVAGGLAEEMKIIMAYKFYHFAIKVIFFPSFCLQNFATSNKNPTFSRLVLSFTPPSLYNIILTRLQFKHYICLYDFQINHLMQSLNSLLSIIYSRKTYNKHLL